MKPLLVLMFFAGFGGIVYDETALGLLAAVLVTSLLVLILSSTAATSNARAYLIEMTSETISEGSDATKVCAPKALTVTDNASKSSFMVSCGVILSSGLQTPAAY